MTRSFSYAAVLHRMFDSAPPEKELVFRAGGRVLRPYRKPGGLYVFVDEPERTVEIACRGYQPELIEADPGGILHVGLYADSAAFTPPAGWSVTLKSASPGSVAFVPDERFDIRLMAFDSGAGIARLQSKPGFLGGCLRLTGGEAGQIALILGKEPPDRYYLSALGGDASGEKAENGSRGFSRDFSVGRVEKGYAARANARGECAFVTPTDFLIANGQQRGNALLDSE